MSSFSRLFLCVLGVSLMLVAAPGYALDHEVIDSPMYKRPDVAQPRTPRSFPDAYLTLWLKALNRPEREMRYQAAISIVRANERGMKGLEVTVEPLKKAVRRKDEIGIVKLGIAQALVSLDAKSTAPELFEVARDGNLAMKSLVEPALAKWGYAPMKKAWLDRIGSDSASLQLVSLALQGLATVGEKKAIARAKELALSSRTPMFIRLEAASALAILQPTGLEQTARGLASNKERSGLVRRLVGVRMLREHKSPEAIELLKEYAQDPVSVVVIPAVESLFEKDSSQLLDLVDSLRSNQDQKVRGQVVEILGEHPTEKNLEVLVAITADDHPTVRRSARKKLHDLSADAEKKKQILDIGMKTLARNDWRSMEQIILLMGQLDHTPVAMQFVDYLEHAKPEVFVSAAWALRKLDVPETCDRVLQYVEAELTRLRGGKKLAGRGESVSFLVIDAQVSQLCQLLGSRRFAKSDKVLRRFIPFPQRSTMEGVVGDVLEHESRAAAIWALGLILENKPDAGLSRELRARIQAATALPPEDERVCAMSAITLGRTKDPSIVDFLESTYSTDPPQRYLDHCCAWAIERISGKKMAKPKPPERRYLDWFLVPNK